MLSPILSAQGRLFACHSERSEESLSFRAQGRLREASRTALKSRKGILRFAQNDNGGQNDNIRQFFISLLKVRKSGVRLEHVVRNESGQGHATIESSFPAGPRRKCL